MKYMSLILILVALVSCSADLTKKEFKNGEVNTIYKDGTTGETLTPLEFLDMFKLDGHNYNVRAISKIPEEERVNLRKNLTSTQFNNLPIEIQHLLPLKPISGMSLEEMHKEKIDFLRGIMPSSLAELSEDDRKNLAEGLTEEDLNLLPLESQKLLSFKN